MARMLNRSARTGRHPCQPEHAHQSLHMLAIDQPALPLKNHHHRRAAIQRVPREFLIDQRAQGQVIVVRAPHLASAIHCGPRDTGQLHWRTSDSSPATSTHPNRTAPLKGLTFFKPIQLHLEASDFAVQPVVTIMCRFRFRPRVPSSRCQHGQVSFSSIGLTSPDRRHAAEQSRSPF
ncbi:MAG: hypothetical protein JWR65_833 [Massilia sp.]|nr:hypothetical protein [Massilia sp.]